MGLAAATGYLGVAGKLDGMNGTDAVRMWAEGEHDKVLKYVRQDARITAMLARSTEENGALGWISKNGYHQELRIPRGWLSVRDALALPEPDTSWMDSPIPRDSFTGWIPVTAG